MVSRPRSTERCPRRIDLATDHNIFCIIEFSSFFSSKRVLQTKQCLKFDKNDNQNIEFDWLANKFVELKRRVFQIQPNHIRKRGKPTMIEFCAI